MLQGTSKKWAKLNKGGAFRKWYGNREFVILWEHDGLALKTSKKSVGANNKAFLKNLIGFTDITTYKPSFRYYGTGFVFDVSGPSIIVDGIENKIYFLLGLLNSSVAAKVMEVLSPSLHMNQTALGRIGIINASSIDINELVESNLSISKGDWDSFEISWDFKQHPFVHSFKGLCGITATPAAIDNYYGEIKKPSCPLETCFLLWQGECNERFSKLKVNEEELNRIFIDIYGLNDELTSEEDDSDVSVRKADLNRDMRSFVSYAVGCMLGRYSLDAEGLAYAGGAWDSTKYTSFIPDEDNVIPVLSDEWFSDDITSQFREFVKVVFGEETLAANMKYVEDALGMSIRNYFTKEFYKDHLKIYQKRPIYWMFSSPKGYFNALVYLHRYNENTPSVVLSYLRKLRGKLATEIGALERENNSKNAKKFVNYRKMAEDLDDYERILYPIAMENIVLDLDDGVKANYAKLGEALKKVPGLEKAE